MFKKNIAVVQTRPLSGKDGKKLRKDLERLYPTLSDDDHKRLFANKTDVNLMRLSNKSQVYACNGGNPLFFDPTGREDVLIPTVYALWICPKLLPSLFTHSEVSPKVNITQPPCRLQPRSCTVSSLVLYACKTWQAVCRYWVGQTCSCRA